MPKSQYQTTRSWQMAHAAYMKIEDIEQFLEFDRTGADRIMSDVEIDEMAEHIKEYGVLHPLGLSWSTKDGHAYLGEGHHRIIAAKRAGLSEVPVMVVRCAWPVADHRRGAARFVGYYNGPERDVWDKPRAPDIFPPDQIGLEITRPGVEVETAAEVDGPDSGMSL